MKGIKPYLRAYKNTYNMIWTGRIAYISKRPSTLAIDANVVPVAIHNYCACPRPLAREGSCRPGTGCPCILVFLNVQTPTFPVSTGRHIEGGSWYTWILWIELPSGNLNFSTQYTMFNSSLMYIITCVRFRVR